MKKPSVISGVDLKKVYHDDNEVEALSGVTIEVAHGERIGVVGPSGSGKTTLLNLLGTLDFPTSGKIIINGIDISTLIGNSLADFRRRNIGFIFQLYNLIPHLTALENVSVPLIPFRRSLEFDLTDRARDLLSMVGLYSRRNHFPSQMSGGEQQRVAIARALINRPKVILADEPTGNLDAITGQRIIGIINELSTEFHLCVMIATHDQSVAQFADRVIRLNAGRLANKQSGR